MSPGCGFFLYQQLLASCLPLFRRNHGRCLHGAVSHLLVPFLAVISKTTEPGQKIRGSTLCRGIGSIGQDGDVSSRPAGARRCRPARIAGCERALIAAAWPHAFRIAYCIVGDSGLAEDAAQEACAILYCKIARLRSPEAFRVWFYRIVTREATALERRHRHTEAADSVEAIDPQPLLLDRIDIGRALTQLSPQQRAAIVLHYYAALNSREIGDILRLPDGTVRSHLLAARRILRDLLADAPTTAAFWETADAV
ncbi:MAG TPA: sigma-70 family RNA polymerase sigma factor [Candidatus Baltobacteraceae bacterium]|nr:sigma-70 family RNA polymerase sigma factor [Candidatus Baltobacteraceae bacterium]